MGNIGSYFSVKAPCEEAYKPVEDNVINSQITPARCNNLKIFDPRSPTVNIDRTPILVVDENFQREDEDETKELNDAHSDIVDPRSPSNGITRTPVALDVGKTLDWLPAEECLDTIIVKEREDLIQVLNFTDLDNLSLSDIEEPVEEDEHVPTEKQPLPTIPSIEETVVFPSIFIGTTSSTPAPSPLRPVKIGNRRGSNIDTENISSNSGKSPSNALLARPRIPFGDVNRPSLTASPRLHLQNKQKITIRSEIQQQQRFIKND